MVAQASTSLSRMRSVQVVVSGKSRRYPRYTIAVAVQLPGRLSMSISQGHASMALRLVGARVYVRASRQFWARLPSTAHAAPLLANRWIAEPAEANPAAVALEKWTRGRTLARCWALGRTGALSYDGTGQVDGISTVVVRDRGNLPGTTPGLMSISAAAPRMLLREVQTGPTRSGGDTNGSCQLSSSGLRSAAGAAVTRSLFHLSAARNTTDFSGYDATVIDAPAGALLIHPQANSISSPARPALAISPPPGFASGTTQAPETGTWDAIGTTTASVGYSGDPAGSTLQRVWTITRSCSQTCTYTLIRPYLGDNGKAIMTHTKLARQPDGWRATWPAARLTCGGTGTDPIFWSQHEVWMLRFDDNGKVAQANESIFSYAPACGYGRASMTWLAKFANSSVRPAGSGQAPAATTAGAETASDTDT